MMHLHMVGIALACAIAIRIGGHLSLSRASQQSTKWQARWRSAIITFVAPPLILIATAVAIVSMGTATDYHPWEGQLSYGLSWAFIAVGLLVWVQLSWEAIQAHLVIHQLPVETIQDSRCSRLAMGKVIDIPAIFSAQVGLWSSELVVSRGLIEYLDDEHLAAVIAHESGHAYYRDTFWFFWLGSLRRLTPWLPYSKTLWQELLLLREIRADCWAARSVDTLVLAESLMSVITAPLMPSEAVCAEFSCAAPHSRLAQRIDALLESPTTERFDLTVLQWGAIALSLMPLLTIPFHY